MRQATAFVVFATLLVLGLGVPCFAQQQPQPGQGPDVYKRDQDLLDRTTELIDARRGAGEETLSDRTLTYNPDGRRDPFRALVGGVAQDEDQRGRLPGIAGLLFAEVKLVGIVEGDEGEPIAIFWGGPEEKGYFVQEGMNFYNGSVHDINQFTSSVVIRQTVKDAIIPYKEIDIFLYPEDAEGR